MQSKKNKLNWKKKDHNDYESYKLSRIVINFITELKRNEKLQIVNSLIIVN